MNKKQGMKDAWNSKLYDSNHSFISNFGNDLLELLAPEQHENILDLGCGTGDLTNILYQKNLNVIGVDNSKNMIMKAKEKYPNINFSVQDVTNLEYKNEFDAIFSNAVLHWVKEPELALQNIYNSLKKGGRFIAEFGGKGNIQIIADGLINQMIEMGFDFNMEQFPWFFPSIGEYSSLMEKVGFKVTFAQHFDRPTPLDGENGLRNWIEMFFSNMFEGIDAHKKNEFITKVENDLKSKLYKDGHWIADYSRIRVIGIKERAE